MKKYSVISLLLSLLFSANVVATQYCPDNIYVSNGVYTPPAGWTVTKQDLPASAAKDPKYLLSFFVASYNMDHQVGNNGNRISCFYTGGTMVSRSSLEITTVNNNLPMPSTQGTKWEAVAGNVFGCGGEFTAVKPEECGW